MRVYLPHGTRTDSMYLHAVGRRRQISLGEDEEYSQCWSTPNDIGYNSRLACPPLLYSPCHERLLQLAAGEDVGHAQLLAAGHEPVKSSRQEDGLDLCVCVCVWSRDSRIMPSIGPLPCPDIGSSSSSASSPAPGLCRARPSSSSAPARSSAGEECDIK